MRPIVRRCAELHLDHIASSGDPFELGSSRPLDFGHWAAHKLEYPFRLQNPSRRSSRHRHRARQHVFLAVRVSSPNPTGAGLSISCSSCGLPIYVPELAPHSRRASSRCHPPALCPAWPHRISRTSRRRTDHRVAEGIGDALDVHEIDTATHDEKYCRIKDAGGSARASGAGNYLATAGGHHAGERAVGR